MKRVFKISKLKNRLFFSLLIGMIAVLVYLLILEINGFEVDLYNLFIFLMLPELLMKLFLFFFCLTLTITFVIVLFSGYRLKSILIQIAAGLIIVLVIGIPEIKKIQSSNLYHATSNPSLDTAKVIDLYEKALKKNNIRAMANIAVHKNLPDSLQAKLSESESIDIRRQIAWETDLKDILINLSKDKDFEDEQVVENPYGWIDSFPQKIKSLQKSFYKYDVKNYQCSLIEEFFYDYGTKVTTAGLVGIDTALCQTLFGNAISVNDIICSSYFYSIEKPFLGFYPITVIDPMGVVERPLILILFDKDGNYINSIEVADSYGEEGGCYESYFLNDSVLKQEFHWSEHDIDSLGNDIVERSSRAQRLILNRNGTYEITEVMKH